MSLAHADQPLLAMTHGQPATPTTFGKEMAVYVHRLKGTYSRIALQRYYGKFNGAIGGFNAHVIAYPQVPWPQLARDLVEKRLDLTYQPMSTQVLNHLRFTNAKFKHKFVIVMKGNSVKV